MFIDVNKIQQISIGVRSGLRFSWQESGIHIGVSVETVLSLSITMPLRSRISKSLRLKWKSLAFSSLGAQLVCE